MTEEANNQYRYIGPRHTALAVASILCLFFSLKEITHRLLIAVEGTIIKSETTTDYRPVTNYVVRGESGNDQIYVSGPTDRSLQRNMPIGTYIKKNRYELSWIKNKETINDFPLIFYVGVCGLGIMLGYWGICQWRLYRPKKRN